MAKINWEKIKSEYVEGIESDGEHYYPNMIEIAERHGCHVNSLRNKASAESWTKQKNIFQAKVERNRRQKRTDLLASEGAEFDSQTLKITNALLVLIAKKLDQYLKDPEIKVKPYEIKSLTSALKDAQTVGRIALGEIDPGEMSNDNFEAVMAAATKEAFESYLLVNSK